MSAQLSIQPKGADAAIKAARGKVGAENLCKDKPPCEDKRQCTDFFFVPTTSLSVSNTFFSNKITGYLPGKCIKSTGECSVSTYTEKQGASCGDGNSRTMSDVCRNGNCVGVSVRSGRGSYYPRCFRKCPKHATCRSRTYYRREWIESRKNIGWRRTHTSACSCSPGYYGSTSGADGVSGKGWNRGGHGGLRQWPRFDGKCYECALGEYSTYWSNRCQKCRPGTYTKKSREQLIRA